MHEVWRLCSDDPNERERFADLDAVLALPSTPAGPKNRLRQVARITVGERSWFLKTFTATQWKNRLRFQTTSPRARDDAERELRVTEALRQAGIGAPRPIAYGRRGPAAFYLCAELEGRAAIELLDRPMLPGGSRALLRAGADFCGRLLRQGFWLQDLSADHVFAARTGDGWSFAVLDLHNGRIGRKGPPPVRLLRRVLRRFARSVRGAAIGPQTAIRFAARLLRGAGRGREARRLLRSLPPLVTASRYEAAAKTEAYAERNPRRADREGALLARVWPGHTGERVLDLPCGAGRLLPFLRERSHVVVQGDGALAMLRRARAAGLGTPHAAQADALLQPFRDRAFDGAVMFRFLHHLPREASGRAIAEACRIADRFVVVSFFHPCSFHHLSRRLRQIGGSTPTRFARSLRAVRADFATHGFRLERTAAELPFARDLWVASFVRC